MFRRLALRNAEGVRTMLTVSLSLLFGLIAFATLAQIWFSVGTGVKRGRLILAELSRQQSVRAQSARRHGLPQSPALAAA